MTDELQNPFERARAAKVARIRAAEATEAQAAEARKAKAQQQKPNTPVTAGGTRLTPELAELKAKSDAEIQARKKQAPVAAAPAVSFEEAKEDALTLVEAFEKLHPETFWSRFNAQNFIFWHLHQVSKGLAVWSLSHMQKSFDYLAANGYFEPKVRTRGQAAAKIVKPWIAPTVQPEQISQAEAIRRSRTEISEEERQRLNSLSFEELRKQARAGFKEDTRNRVTRV